LLENCYLPQLTCYAIHLFRFSKGIPPYLQGEVSWIKHDTHLLQFLGYLQMTRNQAVARIANRTASQSQHLLRSCDVIGHVTI